MYQQKLEIVPVGGAKPVPPTKEVTRPTPQPASFKAFAASHVVRSGGTES